MRNWLIYTDGSFGGSADLGKVHGSVVYWGDNGMESAVHVYTTLPAFVSMNNVGGELIAAWSALMSVGHVVQENNKEFMESYEVNLVHDLQGVGMWATTWKTNKPGTAWYRVQIDNIRNQCPNLKINFIWNRGHSGIPGNEMADKVAFYTMGYVKAHDIPVCNLDSVIKL